MQEDLKKESFALDWMLSESRGDSMIRYLSISYLLEGEGRL